MWVGSGESNNRQSTSWGDGVYKSTDGGKTFASMGLKTSKHINRIVIDPRNTDIVFVAATGNLFGPGGERGVYKTTDSGRSWKQVLKVDDDTGANDLVMDATNSQILYATTYQRRRTACCMNGGGPGSGLWKSIDGGENWTRLKGSGWPDGPLGRIATLIWDGRFSLVTALLAGFGRAAAEVGAVIIVGGNIDGFTRTMTTAIALETSKGDLSLAIGLGTVLIAIVVAVNAGAWGLRRVGERFAG